MVYRNFLGSDRNTQRKERPVRIGANQSQYGQASSLLPLPISVLDSVGKTVLFHTGSAVYGSQDKHIKLIFSHNESNFFRTQVSGVGEASILIKPSPRTIKQTWKIFKGFLNEKKHMGSN